MNNAIPGFLSLPRVNSENIIYAATDGSVNGTVFCGDGDPDFQVILETREGVALFIDLTGESIFRVDKEFRFIRTADQLNLPPGTTYLRVLVDKQPKTFYVVADETFLNRSLVAPRPMLGISQAGQIQLSQGTQDTTITFPLEFSADPVTIIPVVYPDLSADPVYLLTATVIAFNRKTFDIHLSAATNTSAYRLGWAAWI